MVNIANLNKVERWLYSGDQAPQPPPQADNIELEDYNATSGSRDGEHTAQEPADPDDPFEPEISRVGYWRHLENFCRFSR
jgi:hypothetical protein